MKIAKQIILAAVFSLLSMTLAGDISHAQATPASEISEMIKVMVADTDDQFEMAASLSNGHIENATLYREYNYIIFDLVTNGTDAGVLTVVLPRSLIDARTPDLESDDTFTIVLDNYETQYTELAASQSERTLTIPVDAGVVEATIIGTQVLPEFGGVALIAAAMLACFVGLDRIFWHPGRKLV